MKNHCHCLSIKLKKVIHSDKLKDIFYAAGAKVENEKELINAKGETRRIDRMIVDRDGVRVIDYKSTKDGIESHKEQVREYVALLSELYPGKKVTGWLVYLDSLELIQL